MNHAVLGDAGYPGATGAALLGSLNALHLNVALLDNAQPVPRGISLIRLFGSGGAGSLKLAHSSKRVLGETVVVVNESDRRVAVAGLERTAGKPDYQVGSKRCAAFRLLPTGKMTRGWFPGADGAPAAEAAYYAAGLHSGLARAVMGADSIRTFQDLAAPPAQTQLRHVISVVPNPPDGKTYEVILKAGRVAGDRRVIAIQKGAGTGVVNVFPPKKPAQKWINNSDAFIGFHARDGRMLEFVFLGRLGWSAPLN